jgi:hypothetical protein
MRLPRMTTRRWMVAVAVVGLLMGGYRLKQRHDDFLSRAQYHAGRGTFLDSFHKRLIAYWDGRGGFRGHPDLEALEGHLSQAIEYNAARVRRV